MPKPRRLGATKTFRVAEYTTRSPTLISPARGRSRPAIERRVVVLPQPLGPSRVNSLPSGTSNETSCVARIAWPRSPGYSVCSDLTLSTFHSARPSAPGVRHPKSPAGQLSQQDEAEQRNDQHHPEGGQLH